MKKLGGRNRTHAQVLLFWTWCRRALKHGALCVADAGPLADEWDAWILTCFFASARTLVFVVAVALPVLARRCGVYLHRMKSGSSCGRSVTVCAPALQCLPLPRPLVRPMMMTIRVLLPYGARKRSRPTSRPRLRSCISRGTLYMLPAATRTSAPRLANGALALSAIAIPSTTRTRCSDAPLQVAAWFAAGSAWILPKNWSRASFAKRHSAHYIARLHQGSLGIASGSAQRAAERPKVVASTFARIAGPSSGPIASSARRREGRYSI